MKVPCPATVTEVSPHAGAVSLARHRRTLPHDTLASFVSLFRTDTFTGVLNGVPCVSEVDNGEDGAGIDAERVVVLQVLLGVTGVHEPLTVLHTT